MTDSLGQFSFQHYEGSTHTQRGAVRTKNRTVKDPAIVAIARYEAALTSLKKASRKIADLKKTVPDDVQRSPRVEVAYRSAYDDDNKLL